ncbi:MAG: hypothetical protein ISP84_06060 [Candidatus Poseidonia sp.]|nr:hypothetical protein [Poseidonia sp.]
MRPNELGVFQISERRGRREEFNPFAKDASQQHRRRRDERERQAARRPVTPSEVKPAQPEDIQADLERKQREAMEKLEQKGDVVAPAVAPAPVPLPLASAPKEEPSQPLTREDRLAELRRKSEALKKAAPSVQAENVSVVEAAPPAEAPDHDDDEIDSDDEVIEIKSRNKRVKNVFQEIETKVENKQDRRRGRRRLDKKGGGRQKQQKKLNRQKYLEYKYAARDVLDNPGVPEEHRSNILGQVWAKGERQGVDDSLEFIEQKESELILPSEVANELRKLVKQMTTRR